MSRKSALKQSFGSVPPLKEPLSDEAIKTIVAEERAEKWTRYLRDQGAMAPDNQTASRGHEDDALPGVRRIEP